MSSDKPPVYSCVSAYKFILFQVENLENYFHVISLNHVNIISRLDKGQLVLLADYTHKLTSSGRLFDMCKQSCFQDRSFVQCEFIFYFTFCRKSENVICCDNEYIYDMDTPVVLENTTLKCLSIGTPNTTTFPFVPNRKCGYIRSPNI